MHMVDSAETILKSAYTLVEQKHMPLWKTYLLSLHAKLLTQKILNLDATPLKQRDSLKKLIHFVRDMGHGTPLSPYSHTMTGTLMNMAYPHVPQENTLPLQKALQSRNLRFKRPMPIDIAGYHTVMDTSLFPEVMLYPIIEPKDSIYANALIELTQHPDYYVRNSSRLKLAEYYTKRGKSMPMTALYYISLVSDSLSSIPDPFIRTKFHTMIGDRLSFYLRNQKEGFLHYRAALSTLDSIYQVDGTWGLRYPIMMNNVGASIEDDSAGLEILKKSLRLHIELFGKNNESVANVMANMFNRMVDLGMMDSAIALHREMVEIRKRVRNGRFDQYVFLEMVGLAHLYMHLGDTLKARTIARAALDSLQITNGYMAFPSYSFIVGKIRAYEILQEYDSALHWLDLYQNSPFSLDAMITKARLYALSGNPYMAGIVVDSIIEVLKTRPNFTSISRKSYYRYLQSMWESTLPVLIEAGLKSGPIKLSEILKARLLVEDLNLSSDPVMDSLTRKLYSMIDMRFPEESLSLVERRIFLHIVKTRHSLFKTEEPVIPENTAFLGYVITGRKVIGYLVSRRDTLIFERKISRDSLHSMVDRLMEAPYLKNTLSRKLWDILIGPVDTVLSRFERVAISPHGPLTHLSFPILFDGKEFLAQKKYTTYRVFSLWSFASPCSITGPALALGRNDYGENPVLTRRGIGNLKYAEKEAVSVVQSMGGVALTGDEVQEERLYSIKLSEFPVLHFATHAVVDSSSMIVLGPEKDTVSYRDNILRLSEVYSRLRVGKLVVLSGCRTGLGKLINDWEGLFSLSRGFVYTGARCVITTMWDTNDFASYLLMKNMYENLSRGMPVDMALKQAQNYLLRETGLSSPIYWGAFTLTVFGF